MQTKSSADGADAAEVGRGADLSDMLQGAGGGVPEAAEVPLRLLRRAVWLRRTYTGSMNGKGNMLIDRCIFAAYVDATVAGAHAAALRELARLR